MTRWSQPGAARTLAAGVGSGRAQSAVLVPVPAAESVVGSWRSRHDPVAATGVPAHVTLLVPWLPPEEIVDDDVVRLGGLVAGTESFDFALERVGFFGERVLWLAPEPAEPFRVLTAAVAERFGTPPWEGEFDEVIPHLTVAHAGAGADLEAVARSLRSSLPVLCRAEEVWVMIGDGRRWQVRARLPLGGEAGLSLPRSS